MLLFSKVFIFQIITPGLQKDLANFGPIFFYYRILQQFELLSLILTY